MTARTRNLVAIVVGLMFGLTIAWLLLRTSDVAERAKREATQAQEHARDVERTLESVREKLIKEFHMTRVEAIRYVDRVVKVMGRTETPPPTGPVPAPRRPTLPPRTQGPNPIPTEDPNMPITTAMCQAGLAQRLGFDCSPGHLDILTQLGCRVGFDDLFVMDCGKDDKDGPDN